MYRVDRRVFQINDIILPPETSYHDGANFDLTIERILSEQKPLENNADRRTGLFIFPELSDAIRFSSVMSDSKIYKVKQLSDTTCLHRGDMNWTEIMSRLKDNESALRQLSTLYWNGSKTFKPCWEVLVNKMQVVSVVIGSSEERKKMCSDFRTTAGLNIENLNLYLDKLNGLRNNQ